MNFKTEQEHFWSNKFGDEYISRNESNQLMASNLHFFSSALKKAGQISSCREFGANIGMNMKALKALYPNISLKGIEINEKAAEKLKLEIGNENVHFGSIYDADVTPQVQLSLIKGVLIHINPEMLNLVYDKLYKGATEFILIAEYYNPSPVAITYRGHTEKLFKRDFAGEFLDRFTDCVLIDYGFAYKRDPAFPQDDITWFLIEKK
jgi:spore coat polysaccharide biosynthesis protein SpsF